MGLLLRSVFCFFEIVRVHLSCFFCRLRFVLLFFSLTPRPDSPTPRPLFHTLTVSTPAVATCGYFAAIAATSASEMPSDFKNAAASPGAEAVATLPRALPRRFFAFAFALVERRDLPIDDDAKEGTWPLLFSVARVRTDFTGIGVVVGERAKAPSDDFVGTPAAVEKRAIDARIVACDEKKRF